MSREGTVPGSSIEPVCGGDHPRCVAASRAGRPVHAYPPARLVLPEHHAATVEDADRMVVEAARDAAVVATDGDLYAAREAGRPYVLPEGWVDPTRRDAETANRTMMLALRDTCRVCGGGRRPAAGLGHMAGCPRAADDDRRADRIRDWIESAPPPTPEQAERLRQLLPPVWRASATDTAHRCIRCGAGFGAECRAACTMWEAS